MTLTKTKLIRPTKTAQKRSGQHHRVGHHYLKTYWPYLPVVAVLIFGFMANGWLTKAHRDVLGYATDLSTSSLLTDTNMQRATLKQAGLTLNSQLHDAAQAKANDMAARDYWSHMTPDGKTPWSFITASGYDYRTAGENLAYGFTTAQSVISGWMNSPEHRANLLNAGYQDVGFGIANTPNYLRQGPETLVVAMYASRAGAIVTTATAVSPISPAVATTRNVQAPAVVSEIQSRHIARIQLATANGPWGIAIIGVCGVVAFIFLSLRHTLAWRKVAVHGEQFFLHHPLLDIVAAIVVASSALLAHTAGIIR